MTSSVRPLRAPGAVSTRRGAALVLLFALLCTVVTVLLAGPASAAPTDPVAPTAPTAPVVPGDGNVDISIGDGSPSSSITLILAITVLSVAPSVLLLATSFTKIIVVLGLTRNALGLPSSPPNPFRPLTTVPSTITPPPSPVPMIAESDVAAALPKMAKWPQSAPALPSFR